MKSPVKRLSRAEQQQRTQEALLDAAIELFVEQGIDATSIEEVTAHAGFTRGAFYSNFEDKTSLVMAASQRFLENLHAAARPDGPVPEDVGDAYRERMLRAKEVASGGASVFLAEIALYGIRHAETRDAFAAMHQAQLAPAVAFVRDQLKTAGVTKPANVTYDMLANVVQCLTFSLDLFARIDPAIDADRTLAFATRAVVEGLR